MEVRSPELSIVTDPVKSAKAVGLRYVSDHDRGIRRVAKGKTFRYISPDGKELRDAETLSRIKSLAIPPAWKEVWICPIENGHLQATGRDAKGRKQYRYHKRWHEVRDDTKFTRMILFGKALPKIRRRVERDLNRTGLPREKVLATVVRLLETTFIRVGNEEYARDNKSFGLTTLRDKHAQVNGSKIHFSFRGKSAKNHTIDVHDKRLARIVKKCQDLPGQELLQYLDENGAVQDVKSEDVNDYLREISGDEFTAKDFRTWAGTVLAAKALREFQKVDSKAQAKKNILRAIEHVAEKLGNTPSVCKKCYVHPAIFDTYLDGSMMETLRNRAAEEFKALHHLPPEEAAILVLLQERLASEQEPLQSKLRKSIQKFRK